MDKYNLIKQRKRRPSGCVLQIMLNYIYGLPTRLCVRLIFQRTKKSFLKISFSFFYFFITCCCKKKMFFKIIEPKRKLCVTRFLATKKKSISIKTITSQYDENIIEKTKCLAICLNYIHSILNEPYVCNENLFL